MLRHVAVVALLLGNAEAFGKKRKEGAAALRDELDAEADNMKVQQDAMGGSARDYEMENMARHQAGELNTAELGFENMKHAMKDPSAMAEVAELMKDPDNVRQVQKMMADPAFQAQAKKMMQNMPDMSKMMQDPAMQAKLQQAMQDPATMAKAQAMAQAMYGSQGGAAAGGIGGMGGMGGMGGDAAAELARLRAENAALKQGGFA